MSTIDRAFVKTYEGNVRHIVQQMESKLLDTVQVKHNNGTDNSWDVLGSMEATKAPTRSAPREGHPYTDTGRELPAERQDTDLADANWSRRVAMPEVWDLATTTEKTDPTRMLVEPNSNLTIAVAAAMRRAQDQSIIDAATAPSLDSSGTLNDFPESQIIDKTGAILTSDIVSDVQTIFLENHIDIGVQKYAVISPYVLAQLMKSEKATNNDYVQGNALQQYGIVKNWLGFDWRLSTMLTTTTTVPGDPTAPDDVHCLFYTKRAMGMLVNSDIKTMVDQIPMKRYMHLIYSYMDVGSVRIEDEQIVEVKVINV